MKNSRFEGSFRLLSIDFDTLLITGGCIGSIPQSRCISLNINSGNFKDLPRMNVRRKWHAITWLNSFPCVIGGTDGTKTISNAEILVGDEWVEISSLNIARSDFTAVNYKGIIWCFSGFDIDKKILDSVEKFENDCWKIINLRLSQPCNNLGALCLENHILLYGGKTENDAYSDKGYIIDASDNNITECGIINMAASFTSHCLHITEHGLFEYNTKLLHVELDLKKIFS